MILLVVHFFIYSLMVHIRRLVSLQFPSFKKEERRELHVHTLSSAHVSVLDPMVVQSMILSLVLVERN